MKAASRRQRLSTLLLALAVLFMSAPVPARAQSADHGEVTAAGERYRAGPLRRWILGRHYRDLWTAPIQVDVLDLSSFAGGLEPLRTGGGQQTRSLRFLGADGREWSFRSVDKDPSPVLDSLLRGTVVNDLVQDGISAAHPYGALVAGPILDATGILHVDPRLYLMPDDPALGEFREEFAGMLGLIEERPDENEGASAAFRGTERVIGSERLVERLDRGPSDRVDAQVYLKARLVDVLLGDWDRHRGQWRWATYDDGDQRSWLPVPSDRDQAFSKFDGVATRIVSLYMPQFVRFEEDYPSMKRLHWNARALDRWLLSELERPAWDSVGSSIQAALTDDVIREAVGRLPPEIYQIQGEELQATLRARRDRLGKAWDEFYRMISNKVDVRATDADEIVLIDRTQDGVMLVTISAPEESSRPYFSRRFVRDETSEVRLHLNDGDDSVLLRGDADTGIQLRLIGGEGDDSFEFERDGSGVRVYDDEGDNEIVGDDAPGLNSKPFDEWVWSEEDRNQPQDWGSWTYPLFSSFYSTDLGPFIGGGVRVERFGFRKRPYSSRWDIQGGYTPTLQKGRLEVDGRFHTENSDLFWTLGARMSRLDVLHYYGLGNQSTGGSRSFHRVDVTNTSARLGLGISSSPAFGWTVGVSLERLSTQNEEGRFFESLGPVYGSGVFYQLGLGAELTLDPLAEAAHTGNRLRLRLHGAAFPEAFDVQSTFGQAGGEISALLASSPWPAISLAVRVGGEQVYGQFPWHEAAFLGGTSTNRGFSEQRFAGDAAVYASSELRLRAWRPRVVVPVGVGVFGFVDTGRVYLDGNSPGGWKTTLGGGVYFQPVGQPYLARLGAGSSDESTKIFLGMGLPY